MFKFISQDSTCPLNCWFIFTSLLNIFTCISNIHLNLKQDQTWVFSFLQNNVIILEDIPWLRWINIPPSLQDLLLLTCTLLFCFEFFLNNIYYLKLYCIFTHAYCLPKHILEYTLLENKNFVLCILSPIEVLWTLWLL